MIGQEERNNMNIQLNQNESRTLKGTCRIICRKGCLWVTWPGSGDVILTENEELTIRSRGKIFMENPAGTPAEISL